MENVNLDGLADELAAAAAQASSGRAVQAMRAGATMRHVVVALRADHALSDHANPGEATVQVLRGRVRLTAGDEQWEGRQGDLAIIPRMRHRLDALDDSVVVLTVVSASS